MTKPFPRLFTPGPLNTSDAVRAAANADLGSRSAQATTLTANLRSAIADIAACGDAYTVIPLQGSGTFAVEAMLCSLLAPRDHLLIVANGVYGARMADICRIHGIRHTVLNLPHEQSFDVSVIAARLLELGDVSHIAAVHFETALGVLNDVNALAALAARHSCRLLIDAISTFGAIALELAGSAIDAVALSSNKCLHGLPGIAFVIAARKALPRLVRPRTLSLDLHSQWRGFEQDGQWRFTPPLQVMLALQAAIDEFGDAGGRQARYRSYAYRAARLEQGMASIGFTPLVNASYRAPIIITFVPQAGRTCDIGALNQFLFARALVIYPTKHWQPGSFRIGVIGELGTDDIDALLAAIAEFTANAPVARPTDVHLSHS